MNSFLKKTAAFIAAGLMATASLGAECFADSAKLTQTKVELQLAAAVAKPTYTVKGTPGVRKIRLSTTTAGATIYYTTNGTVPTTKSKVYTGALIKITKDTKIKAIAVKGGVSSAVMTKTFYVATMYGDVTGDHQINQNDYSRLKNYIAGNTKYICKDNADCNGSGGISSKDLTVLGQYLNHTINTLPSKTAATSVKKPEATMKKVYGGMQITFSPKTAGSTIYYTTNGSIPTTSSERYTSPFTVTETSQVQAIAYLNGEQSGNYSFNVSVGTLSTVTADKSTLTSYNGEISVVLSNSNYSARILYTTDGSDPRTSYNASIYSGPIKLTKSTTLKAYAEAKAYADSDVSTFSYNISSSYTISGIVWDDTPVNATSSNGVKVDAESGIAGIPVYLINSLTNVKDAPVYYILKTTTDSNGKYSFTNLSNNMTYKVVFEYNYQKYRAYNAIVSGGNQALAYTTIDPLSIRYNGAYIRSSTTNVGDTYYNSVVKYSDAINSSYYKMYAVTNNTYSSSADNVNLCLVSKNYGTLDLSVSVSGQDTATNTIGNGKRLVYTIKLTNNSPLALTTLEQCEVEILVTNAFGGVINASQKTASTYLHSTPTNNGFIRLTWSDFVGNYGLAPGKSAEIQIEGYVDSEPDKKIECYAQVMSYRFGPSCYDYYSVPGNMTVGTVKERDEATTTVVTVLGGSSSGSSSKASMIIAPTSMNLSLVSNPTGTFYISIINGTGTETLQVLHNDNGGVISCGSPRLYSSAGSVVQYSLDVTGLTTGYDTFKVQLVDGSTIVKTQELAVTVKTTGDQNKW